MPQVRLPPREEGFHKRAFAEDYVIWMCGPEWKAQRDAWYSRHPRLCFVCDPEHREHLRLHHVTYERVAAPLDEDLVALCEECHTQAHLYVERHLDDEDSLRNAHVELRSLRLAKRKVRSERAAATIERARERKRARLRIVRGLLRELEALGDALTPQEKLEKVNLEEELGGPLPSAGSGTPLR
jgi:hypothetical protein